MALQGQGNDALKRGLQLKKKFYLREAQGMYTKGLDMGSTLPELESVLHSNRAQAHLLLENYRSALEDSLLAIQLHDSNLKVLGVCCSMHAPGWVCMRLQAPPVTVAANIPQPAEQGYYRGARAALKLGEHQQAADICSKGLAVDAGATELQQLSKEAQRQLQAAADARQRGAVRAVAQRTPARNLAAALLKKGYRVGLPQLSVGVSCAHLPAAYQACAAALSEVVKR